MIAGPKKLPTPLEYPIARNRLGCLCKYQRFTLRIRNKIAYKRYTLAGYVNNEAR